MAKKKNGFDAIFGIIYNNWSQLKGQINTFLVHCCHVRDIFKFGHSYILF